MMKMFRVLLLSMISLSAFKSFADQSGFSSAEMKQFLREAFTEVIENVEAKEEIYGKYFSQDYTQYVNGETLNFKDFVAHMKAQKAVMKTVKVTFKHLLVEGDKITSVHIVDGVKKDGGVIKGQVNAVFQIKDKKIVLCDELTHLLVGTAADRDLGSRR